MSSPSRRKPSRLPPSAALILLSALAAQAQTIRLVDMIPNFLSAETNRDAEPNVAVNPANPLQIAASAFTPDPAASGSGPIFVSTDGGATWNLNVVLPGGDRTVDVTLRFADTSGILYGGILRFDNSNMDLLRKANFLSPGLMTILVDRSNEDQPYTQAATVPSGPGAGLDRTYTGHNDFNAAAGRTATVEQSLDAATAPPPGNLTAQRIEPRVTTGQDGAAIRPAIHPDGTVYAAFYGWHAAGTADIVVVRDDSWGSGGSPFTALTDSGDGFAGQRAAIGVPVAGGNLGTQRVGISQISLAVDPTDSRIVYVAWGDGTSAAGFTLHLRRSLDRGQSWSGDLRTILTATNPAVAVNSQGQVGFLYQRLGNPGGGDRWRTHLELSADRFATPPTDLLLADVPDQNGSYGGINPIGDYDHLMAVGATFYGIFSANNTPDPANFPHGVVYLRNADWGAHVLRDALSNPVAVSIDPFFFAVTPPLPQIQVPGSLGLGAGAVCDGTSGTGTLDVCNTGQADLVVSAIASSNPAISVTTPTAGFPVTISHDFCFPFQVRFAPTATGPQAGTLTIASNDPNHPNQVVAVSGRGTEPDVKVTGSGDFGTASAWSPAEATFSVCNTGECDLHVASATIACSDFSVVNNPFPATVHAGACLDLAVRFTPRYQGLRTCDLSIASDDPDTPLVTRPLRARTPPAFSLHAGWVFPHGALHTTATQGSTYHFDFVYPVRPRWAFDVRLRDSSFDGRRLLSDIDLKSLSVDAKYTINPGNPIRLFVNGGIGAYHFRPGDFEGGGNLGLGLQVPAGPRFTFELTYNYHSTLTASPNLRFSELQLGVLVPF
jgi:hypothetical protein